MAKTLLIAIFAIILTLNTTLAVTLNDTHSETNPTKVVKLYHPKSTEDLVHIMREATRDDLFVSISGGKHSMGGQQFAEGSIHLDMRSMNDVLSFDGEKGILEVEAGIQWPKIYSYLKSVAKSDWTSWTIHQKQTGGDKMTIGGSISVNAHGRVLNAPPISNDVIEITLVDAFGNVHRLNREENEEQFRFVLGGYGLFGVIASVKLQLKPRTKVRRTVQVIRTTELIEAFRKRIYEGAIYGDFQYKTDMTSEGFMRDGILSTYRSVAAKTPFVKRSKSLTHGEWEELYYLAHVNPKKAFEDYKTHYLSTNGQIYWSDKQQFNPYLQNYHDDVDLRMKANHSGREMISELYVPHERFYEFMEKLREYFLWKKVQPIYGTVRLIREDEDTFLPWARENFVAVIINLHIEKHPEAYAEAGRHFQAFIDFALELDGSYYLTYHRFARKDQVLKAYPQFPDFLKWKRVYDPEERFQSSWYQYYKNMFLAQVK